MLQPHRSQYPVLTFTVAALVVFGLCKLAITPYLKPGKVNSLSGAQDQFLVQGASEPVNWQTISEDAITRAKREDKLILLFMGTPWSTAARRIDHDVFQDESIDKYLARNFECIRIDLDQSPSWLSSYLPLQRAQAGLNPICQLIVLSPNGKLLAVVERNSVWSVADAGHFLDELIQVSNQYRTAEAQELSGKAAVNMPGAQQFEDVQTLSNPNGPPVGNPGLVDLIAQSNQTVSPSEGTLIPYRTLQPGAWQFVNLVAGPNQAQALIQPLLISPTVNWLDGGFFWGSSGSDWQTPCYDQPAVPNAQMALLLAKLALLTGNTEDRYLAEKSIHMLVTSFVGESGLIRTSRIGDESFRTFRSNRYSFSPERLRALFPVSTDRQWVWDNLGLRVEENPIMVPQVRNADSAMSDMSHFESVLAKMKGSAKASRFEAPATSGVNGICLESLIQASRILGDEPDFNAASDLFVQLTHLRSGQLILHAPGDTAPSSNLVDYLGFSAAAMADFRSSGRVDSLNQGAQVLNYALSTFPTPAVRGLPASGLNQGPISELPNANMPQISDDGGESNAALVIRLCHEYGQALAQSPNPKMKVWAADWTSLSATLSQQLTPIATVLGIRAGGLFYAQALVSDGRFALAVGSNPPKLAEQLLQIAPQFPVYPAIGPVWPKVQASKPGYYLWVNGRLLGPLSLSEAAIRLNAPSGMPLSANQN